MTKSVSLTQVMVELPLSWCPGMQLISTFVPTITGNSIFVSIFGKSGSPEHLSAKEKLVLL